MDMWFRTTAQLVNDLITNFPGVELKFYAIDERWTTVKIGPRLYCVSTDYEKPYRVTERDIETQELLREDSLFSRRIEGILNGWKRNEAGEMVKPAEVDRG
jgi:hypothetical protein